MRLLILSWVSTRKHLLFWWLALAFLFYLVLPALPLYHFPSNLSTRGFSDDGRFVALTNQNESRFVDITNSEEASRSKKITGMDYYYGSGPIRLLDTVSRQELFAVEDESVVMDNIGFSNDGELLVGSLGGYVKAWDTNTGTTVLNGEPGKLYSVIASNEGVTAAIVLAPEYESQELWKDYRGTVHVVDLSTGRTISKFGPVSVRHETNVSWGQSQSNTLDK